MRIMVVGDTHGNTSFVVNYLYPTAVALGVDGILQVGDYGYWEHAASGVLFNDEVAASAQSTGIEWHFLRGNHDNIDHLRAHYTFMDGRGFVPIRDGLWFIPDGAVWEWGSQIFRAFGGAYSIDKDYRLAVEAARNLREQHELEEFGPEGNDLVPVDHTGTLWFPGEEMTDEAFDAAMDRFSGPVDVIVSHDRPRSVTLPYEHLKNLPECFPTQDKLQRALEVHQPLLWLHGHYHHRYTLTVPVAGARQCTVAGLSSDWDSSAEDMRPGDAWVILDLDSPLYDKKLVMQSGRSIIIPEIHDAATG